MKFTNEYIAKVVQDFAENSEKVSKKAYRELLYTIENSDNMVEYIKKWYNDSKESSAEELKEKVSFISPSVTNKQIVNAYIKAYQVAEKASEDDKDSEYKDIHIDIMKSMHEYFNLTFIWVMLEEFGEDFLKYIDTQDKYDEAKAQYDKVAKVKRSAVQSHSRLAKSNKDSEKIAEAAKRQEEAEKAFEEASEKLKAIEAEYTAIRNA